MSIFVSGIIAVVVIFALLCLGLYRLIVWESSSRVGAPGAPKTGGNAGTTNKFIVVLKNPYAWVGVIVVVPLVYFLWKWISTSDTLPSIQFEGISLFTAGIILLCILALLGVMGKGGTAGKAALGFVAIMVIGYLAFEAYDRHQFGKDAAIVKETIQKRNARAVLSGTKSAQVPSAQKPERVVTYGNASWEQTKDETIPVGVWSEITSVGIGCTVKFTLGGGHKVQYRFYSTEWVDYVPGTSPDASELHFMVTQEGTTNLPYIVLCS